MNHIKRLVIAIGFVAIGGAFVSQPASALDDEITAFGHRVIVKRPRTAESSIEVDGKTIHKNWSLTIDAADLIFGTPVVIGTSGSGGNACENSPFVISFPAGKAARFDGPINTCGTGDRKVEKDRLIFSYSAMPGSEGEKWSWTPDAGFRSDGKTKFAPTAGKGWADLRDRTLSHPMDLFDYGQVTARLDEMVGPRKPQVLKAMSGPGSGRFESDWFIGEACEAHNCPSPVSGSGSITVVDIQGRRIFIAWKPDGQKIEVRPPINEWPTEARRPLATWAKLFEPSKGAR